MVLLLRVRVLSRRRDCKQNVFLVGVPIRYEGFHAVSTVNRWVLGSSARGTGADMPSCLQTKGFWVRVPRYKVLGLPCRQDCQQLGFWFWCQGYGCSHAVRTNNKWVLG